MTAPSAGIAFVAVPGSRVALTCALAMSVLLVAAADGRAAITVELNEGSRQVIASSIGCQGSPGCTSTGEQREATGATGPFGKTVNASSGCPIGGFLGTGSATATQSSLIDVGPEGVSLTGTGSAAADAKRCATSDGRSSAGFSFTVTGSPVTYTLGGLLQTAAAEGPVNSDGIGSAQVSIRRKADFSVVVGVDAASGLPPGNLTPPSATVNATGTLQPGSYLFSVSLVCHAQAGHVDASGTCNASWTADLDLGQPPPPTDDLDASCDAPVTVGGVVPTEDAALKCSAKVTSGDCVVPGLQDPLNAEVTLREAEFWTMSPNPGLARASGQSLTPEEMPAPATLTGPPDSATAILLGRRAPRASDGGCDVSAEAQAVVQGDALVLSRPGPHLMVDVQTVVQYEYTDGDPVVDVCPGSVSATVPAGFEPADADGGDGKTWKPVALCATRQYVHFDVKHPAVTPCALDGADFPSQTGYLNQYAAGSRLNLPTSSPASGGQRGGNACGPSSLLMGMRQAKRTADDEFTALDGLSEVYRQTMQSAPADGTNNVFSSGNALTYLNSLGWNGARVDDSLGNAAQREQQIRDSLALGPVVLSTAFSSNRWGLSGGGHMILLHRLAGDGRNVIVSDPAGDYFAAKTGHYSGTSCGRRVSYPLDWIVGFSSGRWLIELGAPGADPAALLVRDVDRTAADAPQDFWVQDSQGRRTGWIGGGPVSEIPGAQAFTDPLLTSDPDSDENGPPDSAALRALVITDPPADLQLRVRPGAGGYRLAALRYDGGDLVAQDQASGGPGGEQAIAIPAVGISIPKLGPSTLLSALPAAPPLAARFGPRTRVTLKLASRRIPAAGPLPVRVTNANAFDINGRLAGEVRARLEGRKSVRLPLKAKTFRVSATATTTVKLKLPKRLQQLLRRKRSLTVRLTATLHDPAGTSRTVPATVSPKLAATPRPNRR